MIIEVRLDARRAANHLACRDILVGRNLSRLPFGDGPLIVDPVCDLSSEGREYAIVAVDEQRFAIDGVKEKCSTEDPGDQQHRDKRHNGSPKPRWLIVHLS